MKPGEHRYVIEHSYFAKVTGLVRGWETLAVRLPVTITEDEVRIAQQFEQNHGGLTGGRPAPQTFRAELPVTVRLKENLPFGTTWTWNDTAPADPAKPHVVKMLLQKDDTTPRDARLCWNVDFSYVKAPAVHSLAHS